MDIPADLIMGHSLRSCIEEGLQASLCAEGTNFNDLIPGCSSSPVPLCPLVQNLSLTILFPYISVIMNFWLSLVGALSWHG